MTEQNESPAPSTASVDFKGVTVQVTAVTLAADPDGVAALPALLRARLAEVPGFFDGEAAVLDGQRLPAAARLDLDALLAALRAAGMAVIGVRALPPDAEARAAAIGQAVLPPAPAASSPARTIVPKARPVPAATTATVHAPPPAPATAGNGNGHGGAGVVRNRIVVASPEFGARGTFIRGRNGEPPAAEAVTPAAPAPQPAQRAPEQAPVAAASAPAPVAAAPAAAASSAPVPAAPSTAMVVERPLRSGQSVRAHGRDLVLLAGVSPGAEVIADGSIHCYGTLRGRALAGAAGDTTARIYARRFEAELVSIAGVYRTFETLDPSLRDHPVRVGLQQDGGAQSIEVRAMSED